MNAFWNKLIETMASALDARERECVLGDLAELDVSGPTAAASLLGLVLRRQLDTWKHGQPVPAGVAVPASGRSDLNNQLRQCRRLRKRRLQRHFSDWAAGIPRPAPDAVWHASGPQTNSVLIRNQHGSLRIHRSDGTVTP